MNDEALAEQTIFISIASYCDPLLKFTISNAFANARRPGNLRFGVVDQSPVEARMKMAGETAPRQISYVHIQPRDARGACWARAIGMSLYQGEDWFLQIDSHMLFEPDWDDRLIASARQCARINPKCIVSSYPNAFEIIDGKAVPKYTTRKILAHIVKRDSNFDPEHIILNFYAVGVERDEPLIGFHLGAGCVFAPGRFVSDIPYDPHLYFHGEEQTLAARAYTHGWDIFHVSGLPVLHLYNFGEAAKLRPLHWSEEHDKERQSRWWELEARSKKRVHELLVEGKDLGVYGLGTVRTLQQYMDFSGLDYTNKVLHDAARHGPWNTSTA
ncbi:MAG: GlcNAc-transferase family protein [Burkholderiaceae bacterium]|jgi:hypothetical protein